MCACTGSTRCVWAQRVLWLLYGLGVGDARHAPLAEALTAHWVAAGVLDDQAPGIPQGPVSGRGPQVSAGSRGRPPRHKGAAHD